MRFPVFTCLCGTTADFTAQCQRVSHISGRHPSTHWLSIKTPALRLFVAPCEVMGYRLLRYKDADPWMCRVICISSAVRLHCPPPHNGLPQRSVYGVALHAEVGVQKCIDILIGDALMMESREADLRSETGSSNPRRLALGGRGTDYVGDYMRSFSQICGGRCAQHFIVCAAVLAPRVEEDGSRVLRTRGRERVLRVGEEEAGRRTRVLDLRN